MERDTRPGAGVKGVPQPWRWVDPETGDTVDSETLITDNLKLARKYAWNWARKSGMAYDDLEAVAFIGLVKGCRRFDPASGYRLSTICVPYINGEILHWFRDRGYAVKFPARWRELLPRARRLLDGGVPFAEVCEGIGLSPAELEEMLAAMAGTSELHDELVGESDAAVEMDVLQPLQHLVMTAWERLHQADRKALEVFWDSAGRRVATPIQQLRQFITAARLALHGKPLPEVRKQLSLELGVTPEPVAKPQRRQRSVRELCDLAEQLGLPGLMPMEDTPPKRKRRGKLS